MRDWADERVHRLIEAAKRHHKTLGHRAFLSLDGEVDLRKRFAAELRTVAAETKGVSAQVVQKPAQLGHLSAAVNGTHPHAENTGGSVTSVTVTDLDRARAAEIMEYGNAENIAQAIAEARGAAHAATAEDREGLTEALRRASEALDDWVCDFAGEFCAPEHVAASNERVARGGGRLSYIATVREHIAAAFDGRLRNPTAVAANPDHDAPAREPDLWFQRVAIAIRDACPITPHLQVAEHMARAAIKAMREPTIEMEIAGTEEWTKVAAMEDRAIVIWRAMIDAAQRDPAVPR